MEGGIPEIIFGISSHCGIDSEPFEFMEASPTRMEWRWPHSAASASKSCNWKKNETLFKHSLTDF